VFVAACRRLEQQATLRCARKAKTVHALGTERVGHSIECQSARKGLVAQASASATALSAGCMAGRHSCIRPCSSQSAARCSRCIYDTQRQRQRVAFCIHFACGPGIVPVALPGSRSGGRATRVLRRVDAGSPTVHDPRERTADRQAARSAAAAIYIPR
jgi:hypothetical protein